MKPLEHRAKWKRFPAAKAKKIWDWLNGDPEKEIEPLGQRKVIALIKKRWGVALSTGELSKFYSWYKLELNFASLQQRRSNFEELLLEKFPTLDSKAIQEFGQAWFTMQAVSRGDGEEYREMEKLWLKKEKEQREGSKLGLDREKFETETSERILDAATDERILRIADSNLPHGEKIAAIRKIAFADVDALEQSGAVTLPKSGGR